MKGICDWISGFGAGCFLGALIACPDKVASLSVSAALCAMFAWLGRRK